MKKQPLVVLVLAALLILAFGTVIANAQSRSDMREEAGPPKAPYVVTLPDDEDEEDDSCNPFPPIYSLPVRGR